MSKKSLILRALWSVLGATMYIAFISAIFALHLIEGGNGPLIFQQMAPILLVVFSVMVMGILLIMPSLRLYLDGKKTEGIRLIMYTGMWLGIFTVLAMAIMSSV